MALFRFKKLRWKHGGIGGQAGLQPEPQIIGGRFLESYFGSFVCLYLFSVHFWFVKIKERVRKD